MSIILVAKLGESTEHSKDDAYVPISGKACVFLVT